MNLLIIEELDTYTKLKLVNISILKNVINKKGFEIYCNYQGAIKSDGDLKKCYKISRGLETKISIPL
ncbi:MAG: hypothetical protein ACLTAI_00215 [Thomasclavelia sp.]